MTKYLWRQRSLFFVMCCCYSMYDILQTIGPFRGELCNRSHFKKMSFYTLNEAFGCHSPFSFTWTCFFYLDLFAGICFSTWNFLLGNVTLPGFLLRNVFNLDLFAGKCFLPGIFCFEMFPYLDFLLGSVFFLDIFAWKCVLPGIHRKSNFQTWASRFARQRESSAPIDD